MRILVARLGTLGYEAPIIFLQTNLTTNYNRSTLPILKEHRHGSLNFLGFALLGVLLFGMNRQFQILHFSLC